MALSARLNLRQAQSMTMTPQLLQSIKLLQFSQLELEQFVDSQIESNPLIERITPADENFVDRDNGQSLDEQNSAPADNSNWENAELEVSAAAISDKLDTSLVNVFPDDPGNGDGWEANVDTLPKGGRGMISSPGLPTSGPRDVDYSLEDIAASQKSLRDVIAEQVPFLVDSIPDRAIAAELTDRLDERGYVEVDMASLSSRLGCEQGDILRVLKLLQACDPAGVFARDLSECLSLQCARNNRLDPAMQALLGNLDLLAKRDFKTLSRICGVDEPDLLDMLSEIKRLDPKPGLAYETGGTQAIVHDVEVTQSPDGTWRIELNNDALPKIIVDRQYYAEISRSTLKSEEKSFVSECLADATWLERSLDQRAATILKVTTEIVRQQDAFLVKGVSALRPMTMKSVADAIKMHESTVSRVASNKYMLTPRGLFELRYFFTVAIPASDGSTGDHSSESVRHRISEMIDAETTSKILSDDALVSMLKLEGVDIARRTVAKYREGMNIPSSVQRRREKKARLAASNVK